MKSYLYPDPDLNLPQPYFELNSPETRLGRHPDNDISVLVDSISRFHARIYREGGHFFLKDLGSSNGSFLNGQRLVDAVKLADGDTVTLGRVDCIFSLVEPAEWKSGKRSQRGTSTSSVQIVSDDDSANTILSVQKESTPFSTNIAGIENSEALETATHRLMTLYRLNDILRNAADEDEALQILADLVFENLICDRLAILMVSDRESMTLEPRQVRSRGDCTLDNFSLSRTIVEKSMSERIGILSRDTRMDKRFTGSESIMMSDIRSAMCIPLISQQSLLGILFIDSRETVNRFNEDDMTFTSRLAADVAITIDNLVLAQQKLQNERLAAVGQTIAGLAHNIKNILQLARGGMELMDSAVQRDSLEDLQVFWPVVRRGIDRMQSLTQEMLDYSRQTAPRLIYVGINEVIDEMVRSFEKDKLKDGVELSLNLEPELPARKIDPDGLSKALINLVSNALDALDGNSGKIEIVTVSKGSDIIIRVEDDGRGIPRDKRERIFQPFFTTKGSKGTGLGLSMTRKYIEDMQGTIHVDSEEGRGTRFTITLPPLPYQTQRADSETTDG